jgi:hypothetical protein
MPARFVTFATPRALAKVVFAAVQLASHGLKTTTQPPVFVLEPLGVPQPQVWSMRGPAAPLSAFAAPRAFAKVASVAQLASQASETTTTAPASALDASGAPQPRSLSTRRPAASLSTAGGSQ